MTANLHDDVSRLAAGRVLRPLMAGDALRDAGEARRTVHLVLAGGFRLAAETPFGPHTVGEIPAPVLFDLRSAVGGAEGVCRAEPFPGSSAAIIPVEEARRLLVSADPDGSAFRRVALSSLTSALRTTLGSLASFFDPPSGAAAAPEPALPPPAVEGPVDPETARELLDAAGLDPSLLPRLGLVAREVQPGATLFAEGETGKEAAIVAKGRLRVSLTIPGAGEEALAFLGPGEIVGEMSLLDDAPRSASVFSHNGPATVYVLTRDVFR
ncbi:MAG: cyclic nucleotide-binding domain-containing protein, partial [Acidithiobacillales bacterium]